ncbi:amino acid transporter [Klebsormidium nitens]|uniref:Amino acid transporter n=1 Tax=Klebsormidium nitens TaxID=105231 RepID=A0A1Y1IBK6_KLENI|nr:amino acid transporter [Klebsormidium nitens]|eukprot:GAQ88345.1 amino acid transporter [Klebsormidium nitens]
MGPPGGSTPQGNTSLAERFSALGAGDIADDDSIADVRAPLLDSYADEERAKGTGAEDESGGLHRRLTFVDGISVVVGIIVGSGIFASPGVVLQSTGSVGLSLLAWLGGGTLAMLSALIYAELGSSIPHAGGDSHYLRIGFSNVVSFMYTWTSFFVLNGGGLSIVSVTFAQYMGSQIFDDYSSNAYDWRVKGLSLACIVVLTLTNCFGVQMGSWVQNVLSGSKLVLVLLLAGAAVVYLHDEPAVAARNMAHPFRDSQPAGFGPGMVAALWAFDGWSAVTMLGEELKNPGRDMPRSIVFGMLTVIVIYVTANVAYLCILPVHTVKFGAVVAVDAVERALGTWAGSLTAILVALSTLGSANATIMCGGRYLYAASRAGQIPSWMSALGQKSRAPYAALLAQGAWACLLLLCSSASLSSLINYFGVASWVFYGLSALSLVRIRARFPSIHRPFKLRAHWAFSYSVFGLACYLVLTSLMRNAGPASAALGFALLSIPVYKLTQWFRGGIPHIESVKHLRCDSVSNFVERSG